MCTTLKEWIIGNLNLDTNPGHYLEFKPQHHQTVNTACASMLSEGGTSNVHFLLKLQSFLFLTESKQVLVLCHGAGG